MTPETLVVNCKETPGLEAYDGELVVRRISYGDKADIIDNLVVINEKTQRVRVGQLRVMAIVYGVKSAPFFPEENGPLAPNWDVGLTDLQFRNRVQLARRLDDTAGIAVYEKVVELNPHLTQGVGALKKESPTQ